MSSRTDPIDIDVLEHAVWTYQDAEPGGTDLCFFRWGDGRESAAELGRCYPVVPGSDEDARLRECARTVVGIYCGHYLRVTCKSRWQTSRHLVYERCKRMLNALLLRGAEVELHDMQAAVSVYEALLHSTPAAQKTRVRRAFLEASGLDAIDFLFHRAPLPRTDVHRDPIRLTDVMEWSRWADFLGGYEVAGLATYKRPLRLTGLRTCADRLCQILLHFASTRDELCDLLTSEEVQRNFFLYETLTRDADGASHSQAFARTRAWALEDLHQLGYVPALDATTNWRVAAWQTAMLTVALGPKTATSAWEWEAPEAACVEMLGLLPDFAWRDAIKNVVLIGPAEPGGAGPMDGHRLPIPGGVIVPAGHAPVPDLTRALDASFNPFLCKAGLSTAPWMLWYTTLAWATHRPETFPFADFSRAIDHSPHFEADAARGAYTPIGPRVPLADEEDELYRPLTRYELLRRLWKLWTLSAVQPAATCSENECRGAFATLTRSRDGVGWLAGLYGMAKPTTPWQRAKFHWHLVWLWATRIRPYAVFWAETAAAAAMARHEAAQRAVRAERAEGESSEGFDEAVEAKLAREAALERWRRHCQGKKLRKGTPEWHRKCTITASVFTMGSDRVPLWWRIREYRRRRMRLAPIDVSRVTLRHETVKQEAAQRRSAYPKAVRLPPLEERER